MEYYINKVYIIYKNENKWRLINMKIIKFYEEKRDILRKYIESKVRGIGCCDKILNYISNRIDTFGLNNKSSKIKVYGINILIVIISILLAMKSIQLDYIGNTGNKYIVLGVLRMVIACGYIYNYVIARGEDLRAEKEKKKGL